MPFRGKYDDYGGIEDWEATELHQLGWADILKRWPSEAPESWNKDGRWEREQLTWASLLECVERGEASLKSRYHPHQMSLGQYLVHEDVWQAVVKANREKLLHRGWQIHPCPTTWGDEVDIAIEAISPEWDSEQGVNPFVEMRGNVGMRFSHMVKAALDSARPEQLLDEIKDFALFNYGMSSLRKAYYPQCGAGSQECEEDLHLVLGETVRSVIELRRCRA